MARTNAAGTKRSKPVEGHKCAGARLAVYVACECGWSSTSFMGDRARRDAYHEFRDHQEQHRIQIAARDHGEQTKHVVATQLRDGGARCTECQWTA